jgi:hypothetical protein
MVRCFLCHTLVSPASAMINCHGCGARFAGAGYDAEKLRAEAAAMIGRSRVAIVHGRVSGPVGWSLDLHGLRAAASRWGRVVRLPRLFRKFPTRLISWPARIEAMETAALPGRVALGGIARAGEADALIGFADRFAPLFGRLAFVIDGSEAEADSIRHRLEQAAAGRCDVAVAAFPLNGDFGAQRNRVQALAGLPWILQLDTDERPDPALVRNLGAIVADADRWGNRIIAFPRINLVDDAPSAFYPDAQYRLVRSDIRFTRKVHETPLDGIHWRDIQLTLAGRIEHRLSSGRVRARSQQYEAIAQGGGKPDDERLLLLPAAKGDLPD